MIFLSSPRAITAAPNDLQAVVQRVLDVPAQQIMPSGTAPSTNMDLRLLGNDAYVFGTADGGRKLGEFQRATNRLLRPLPPRPDPP